MKLSKLRIMFVLKAKLSTGVHVKELLVAIDGSEHSTRIIEAAIGLAKAWQAKIALLYVVPSLMVPKGYEKYAESEGEDPTMYLDAVAHQVVSDMGAKVQAAGVELEALTEHGHPAETILRIAESRGDDAIVVGVQGLHGLGRMRALGSVSRRVTENSKVPVICVP